MSHAADLLGSVYQKEAPFLGRILYKMTGEAALAEDLLHETFVVALEKFDSFDPSRGALGAWLYGIARNRCLHRLRSERRFSLFQSRVRFEPSQVVDEVADPVAQDQEAQAVQKVLNDLPPKMREVLILYELEEMPGEEIARLLGVPKNTIWTRLHHARKRFLRLWNEGPGSAP